MTGIIILILLAVILVVVLRKLLLANYKSVSQNCEALQGKYEGLIQENSSLIQGNDRLRTQLEETTALYDITKEMCKYLDEDKVFGIFKEQVAKYTKNCKCEFFGAGAVDLSGYNKGIIIPLEIDRKKVGYLAAAGVLENEREKFNILAQQFVLGIRRAVLYRRISELAITDTLTGVLSRRHWFERFNQEVERSTKFKHAFSLLMIDIDYFKACNDRYGHLVGDAILKEVASKIKENIRQIDLVCRYGGEEFSVILTEIDKDGAVFAATRIRQAVEAKSIKVYDEDLTVTISIGISVFPEHAKEGQALLEKADHALYRAKQSGRNKVCVHRGMSY